MTPAPIDRKIHCQLESESDKPLVEHIFFGRNYILSNQPWNFTFIYHILIELLTATMGASEVYDRHMLRDDTELGR